MEVVAADGQVTVWPDLRQHELTTTAEYVNDNLGTELNPDQIASLLTRMSLHARVVPRVEGGSEVHVSVPITRSGAC